MKNNAGTELELLPQGDKVPQDAQVEIKLLPQGDKVSQDTKVELELSPKYYMNKFYYYICIMINTIYKHTYMYVFINVIYIYMINKNYII